MKILLVGCNGLLGQNLLRARPAGGWEIHGAGKASEAVLPDSLAGYHRADIGKRNELEAVLRAVDPDRIFNAAAVTDVDLCEREPALAGHQPGYRGLDGRLRQAPGPAVHRLRLRRRGRA